MLISSYDVDYTKTQDEIDALVNQLLLNTQEFSRIAGIDGRLFRVITHEDTCDSMANPCTQDSVQRSLISIQKLAEQYLGYELTDRYHYEEIEWHGEEIVQLSNRGVVALNVIQSIGSSIGEQAISPFVEEDLITYNDGGKYYVDFRSDLAGNPLTMQPRNADNDYFKVESVQRSGADWKANVSKVGAAGVSLDIQNPRLMIADLENPVCTGTVYPVYPGTNQKIPMAKPPEAIDVDNTRYFFRPWMLVDPAFKDDTVNLEGGEFYKLLQSIDFKCFGEAEQASTVTITKKSGGIRVFETGTETLTIDIIDADRSILYVQYGTECESAIHSSEPPIKLKVYYKTSPDAVVDSGPMAKIMEAIAYYVAAEIPLEICECPDFRDKGFIHNAQKSITELKLNPITGEIISVPGKNPTENQYGKMVFWATLKYFKRKYKGVRI